jgi:hypothetical protein
MTFSSRWPFIEPERARSVPVQLGLLGVTFVGALGLALLTLCLRSIFFERYVRETYPPLTESAEALMTRLEHPPAEPEPPKPKEKSPEPIPIEEPATNRRFAADWDSLYSLWMNPPAEPLDEGRLRKLLWSKPEATLPRVRTTSVVGNVAQRTRALELLSSIPDSPVRDDAVALSWFVRERARRRGERSLFTRADQVYQKLVTHHQA